MKFFSKKQTTIMLAALMLIGSPIAFYGTNLILSDVANMFYMTISEDFITSLPIFFISLQMAAGFICLVDLAAEPENGRNIIVGAMDVIVFTSLLGFGSTIVSYAFIYSNFMDPYPFKGASVVLIVYYVIVFLGSSFLNVWGQGLEKTKKNRSFGNAVYKILRAIFVYYAFNRFGALLVSPSYMRWKTFALTLPFYLSLLIPITFISLMVYFSLGFDSKSIKSCKILAIVLFAADIILSIMIFWLGTKYTEFPAAISPALPLERLVSVPMDVIIQSVISTALAVYALIATIKRSKNEQR